MASALDNAFEMVRDDRFCINAFDDGLSSLVRFSHAIQGSATVGETGPVVFTIDTTGTEKMQCFEMTAGQTKDLDDELWYFSIHNEMYNGCIDKLKTKVLVKVLL